MSDKDYQWLKYYPEKPDWHMKISPKFLPDFLSKSAKKTPDAVAMDFVKKDYTYQEIEDSVNAFAAGLQQDFGVKKGIKVGLFLPNSPYFLIAYYAVLKIGGTVVNYNPLYAEHELVNQVEDSHTDILITVDLKMLYEKAVYVLAETRLKQIIVCKFADALPFPKNLIFPIVKAKDMADVGTSDNIVWFDTVCKKDEKPKKVKVDLHKDIALLQYTGGTTGVPKGAMLTHANLSCNAIQCYSHFPKLEEQGRMLAVLPFFHVFSMTVCMNMAIMAGMEIITIPRFDLNNTLKIIDKREPHYMPAVPAIFTAMNHHPKSGKYDLSSLQFCISGGAPLPVEVKKRFEANTGAIVVEGYGLTESSPVACVNPPFGDNVAGSIGMPLPQTIIEIIDPEDKKTPVSLGGRGELCIRGPQVMKGYWNKPEDTDDVLRDGGRLHTGDIATMDERGYVYIVDRIKDMIITNGYKVYPRHVEEAIYEHEDVEECIVAGLPNKQRGEIVKAWIKPKEGKDINEVDMRAFLQDKISTIEIPKQMEFRKQPLPKTMIGKLSRKDIVAEEMEKLEKAEKAG